MIRSIRAASAWRNVAGWCWMFGFVALPLLTDLLRIESYESPRAMFSAVIGVAIGLSALAARLCLPHPLSPSPKAAKGNHSTSPLSSPLTLAVIAWGVSISLSAILSLSPTRSIFGDLYRRMGLLTQLSLLAAFVGGALITRRRRGQGWPLLAISGSIIAINGIAQRFGLSPFVQSSNWRPSSTLGTSIFAASWCLIAILWLVAALAASPDQNKRRVYLYRFSLIALVIFFIFTESRGAALGLGAGLSVLVIVWAVAHGQRQLITRFLFGIALVAVLGFALASGIVNLRGSPLANLPLIGRLNTITDDQTSNFRLALWRSAGQIVREWPTVVATNGQSDPSGIRPLIGYGQEMFQFVEHQYADEALAATYPPYEFIDRAHNVLLDTWTTQGYLGLVSLLAVYIAAAWLCLKVLRQQGMAWGERGWIAAGVLAILVGHVVDLQFSFPSVASEWPFWASLGLLVGVAREPVAARSWPNPNRIYTHFVPVLIWVVIWALGAALIAALMRPVMLPDPATLRVDLLRGLLLAYHALFVLGLGLIGIWQINAPYRALFVLALLVPGAWWALDSTADSLARMARSYPGSASAQFYDAAIPLKTPDDRLLLIAGENALTLAYEQPQQWLERAGYLLNQAIALNPYDADLTVLRASDETFRAITRTDPVEREAGLARADDLYQTAAAQWPGRAALWLEWARFTLTVRQQPERAIELARQAQQRLPAVPAADRLIGDAYRALWADTAEPEFAAQAETAYRAALTRDRKDTAAALALADLLHTQGRYGGAKAVLMQALRHSTRITPRIQVTLALARTLEAQHNLALALRYVRMIDDLPMDWLQRINVSQARDRLLQQVAVQPR